MKLGGRNIKLILSKSEYSIIKLDAVSITVDDDPGSVAQMMVELIRPDRRTKSVRGFQSVGDQ